MRIRLSGPAVAGALLGIFLSSGIVRADITLERSTAVEGVGAMAFANMSGTSKTAISGDKSRTDSDMKMQSKLIGFLARNSVGPSAEIVRLDDDRLYHLNVAKKEYTETTFEQLREQLKKMSDQADQAEDKQKQPSAIDESQCDWLPPKVDVKRTGEKGQFAGFEAERLTILASQPCKDKKTGAICEVALTLDEWLSSAFSDSAEAQKFYQAYAAKMGLDPAGSADITQRARALFSRYQGIWKEIASKMQGVKGYPVKSSFTLSLGGEQCKNPNEQQAQAQTSDSADAGSSIPRTPGALAGAMAGKLGGLFHKKKDDSEAPPAPAAAPPIVPPGDVAVMTVSSQLVSVSTTAVPAEAFNVPADYTKIQPKTR